MTPLTPTCILSEGKPEVSANNRNNSASTINLSKTIQVYSPYLLYLYRLE